MSHRVVKGVCPPAVPKDGGIPERGDLCYVKGCDGLVLARFATEWIQKCFALGYGMKRHGRPEYKNPHRDMVADLAGRLWIFPRHEWSTRLRWTVGEWGRNYFIDTNEQEKLDPDLGDSIHVSGVSSWMVESFLDERGPLVAEVFLILDKCKREGTLQSSVHISSGAIQTAHIAGNAVTTRRLGSGSVASPGGGSVDVHSVGRLKGKIGGP